MSDAIPDTDVGAEAYDFTYIVDIFDEVGEPYKRLANYATELGLKNYIPKIEEDAAAKQSKAAYAAINSVGNGLVEQVDLAQTFAVIDNDYQTARAEVAKLAISSSIIDTMITNAETEAKKLKVDILSCYKESARNFVSKLTQDGTTEAEEVVLESLTDKELEAAYDTRPITKEEILKLAGAKSSATRYWRPLAIHSHAPIQVGYYGRDAIVGPQLSFGTKPEDAPRRNAFRADEITNDLDFISFYRLIEWVSKTLEDNKHLKISELFGERVGKQTIDFYKKVILSRSIDS